MMMQNWMGTDFTNDDLVQRSSISDDYKNTIIGEENIEGYDYAFALYFFFNVMFNEL